MTSVGGNVGDGVGVSVIVGDGTGVSVGVGVGDGVKVRVGGITYVIVGVNVAVRVGVRVTVGEITGTVYVGVKVVCTVPSEVDVAVGVFCSRTRLAFHNKTIPRQ